MMEERLARLLELRDEQGVEGNYDFDPFNFGFYHGLALAASIMEDKKPKYKELPENWGCESLNITGGIIS